MPKIYEDDIRKAGLDPNKVRAEAEAEGVEWVPSQIMASPQGPQRRMGIDYDQTGWTPPAIQRGFINIDPSIGPPTEMERFGMSLFPAFALPGLGGAIAGGGLGMQMLGQGLGMAANEAFDYFTQPPERKPTLGEAALRTGLGVGMIGGGGWVANKMFPAVGKGGAAIPPPQVGAPPSTVLPPTPRPLPNPPQPTAVPERVGREVATSLGQTIKDKVDDIFNGLQEETVAKGEEIAKISKEIGEESMVDVRPLINRLKTFFGDPEKVATLNPAEDAARNELERRAGEIGKEAALNGGRISLERAYKAMTKFGARGYEGSPQAKSEVAKAYKILRAELKEGVEQHISRVAPDSAKIVKEYNRIIHGKLSAAEDLDEFLTTDPAVVVKRLQSIPKAKEALTKLDEVFGTEFTKNLDEYAASVAEVERLRKAIPAANKAAERAFKTTSKAIQSENLAQASAAEAATKAAQKAHEMKSKAVMEQYDLAVKAADKAKERALKSASVVSRLLGGAIGYYFGKDFGFPGSPYMGAVTGFALGPKAAPAVARGLVTGGKAIPPLVYPTEIAISSSPRKGRK